MPDNRWFYLKDVNCFCKEELALSPQRIVIADNESIIRMDLRELLEEAGHQVVGEGANGKKAVELARKLKPDLIILDIKMP